MRRVLVIAIGLAALAPGVGSGADAGFVAGGAMPRIEPLTVRAVACGEQSCLDIAWRVRGEIGPALRWHLLVQRSDGAVVYRGSGASARGRRVSGLLRPSTPPRCGRHLVTLLVEDRDGDHLEETRAVVRRTRCAPPAA
jgi:hypothetical protein